MIFLDANVLIYAVNEDAPLNRKTKRWLEFSLSGSETVGFSWNVLLAFLRLSTRPGLFRNPLTVGAAFDVLIPGSINRRQQSYIPAHATRGFFATYLCLWAQAGI
jgi:predicted nucleic acid-binding protein